MYRVRNESSRNMVYNGQKVAPGEQVIIIDKTMDRRVFEIGTAKCDIKSLCGKHTAEEKGNIECSPRSGEDSTVFVIREVNE